MRPIFFCNIGWMSRYEGLDGKPDKIVGGGRWVAEHGNGGEVCNFLKCPDGHFYGHVETIKGDHDRKLNLSSLDGAARDWVAGVDVVWTATDPDQRGRRVVGWYRNATVYRERQEFTRPPSKQHSRDGLSTYRVRARDAVRLELGDRRLTLGRGPGWMGHAPWWTPASDASPEVHAFVRRVRSAMASDSRSRSSSGRTSTSSSKKSPSTARDAYQRYMEAYELEVSPRHHRLQSRFERYLNRIPSVTGVSPNVGRVDVRFRIDRTGLVLAEVKPCDSSNARFAIRTAIGQLFDYAQREKEPAHVLVVLEAKPNEEDAALALSNSVGVAYPISTTNFKLLLPSQGLQKR